MGIWTLAGQIREILRALLTHVLTGGGSLVIFNWRAKYIYYLMDIYQIAKTDKNHRLLYMIFRRSGVERPDAWNGDAYLGGYRIQTGARSIDYERLRITFRIRGDCAVRFLKLIPGGVASMLDRANSNPWLEITKSMGISSSPNGARP